MGTALIYGEGGFDPKKPNNNIIEVTDEPDLPLDSLGAVLTLLTVKGVLTVEEAASTVGLSVEHLEREAIAWDIARRG